MIVGQVQPVKPESTFTYQKRWADSCRMNEEETLQ